MAAEVRELWGLRIIRHPTSEALCGYPARGETLGEHFLGHRPRHLLIADRLVRAVDVSAQNPVSEPVSKVEGQSLRSGELSGRSGRDLA